ncbi:MULTISPECIES: DUF1612 domain-containing protein [unclassified Mesorhizobium]
MLSDAWEDISPLQHQPWLGTLLVARMLRQRRKTAAPPAGAQQRPARYRP